MSIFDANIQLINKFLDRFKSAFSKRQFSVFKLLIYALLKDYKRNSLSAMASNLAVNYQNFQYFFSDAKWNPELLNNTRLNTLKPQRTTGFSKNGILVIDDTGSLKPYAEKTEGVKYQYCPSVKDKAYCNVAVGSCFVYGNKHIPINLKFYKPEDEFEYGKYDDGFRSKIDFAKELVYDALDKDIPFSYVVTDSWFPSRDFVEFVDGKTKKLISEVRSNRHLLFRDPRTGRKRWVKQDELVTLIKKYLWHKTNVFRHKDSLLPVYAFETYLKDCSVPIKAFVVFGKLSDEDEKDAHILITNDLKLSHKKIIPLYEVRWGIEQLFRELKDSFFFDQYQVRHKEKIMRYWILCLLAWTLCYWIRVNAYLAKILSRTPSTCNEFKQALAKLILFSSYSMLRKNRLVYDDYFSEIRSARFRRYCLAA